MLCCVEVDVVLCRCSVASMFCCVNVLLCQCFVVRVFSCACVLLCVCSVVRVLCVIDLHGCAWLCVFVRVAVWPCVPCVCDAEFRTID